jgi:hypothetical protein
MKDWAIGIHEIFDSFLDNLSKIESLNIKGLDHTKIFEFDQIVFNKISEAFENIYPNLYIGFENYWYHPRIWFLEKDERSAEKNG